MSFPDLRTFIDALHRDRDVVTVDTPVDPHLEAAEIHRRVIAAGGPALIFTNVKGSRFRLATNLFGTARGDEFIGPGYLNWDFSFIRNIRLGKTSRLQFRTELYNAFNNVQFSTVNTNAVFNAAGQQTNAEFGQYTAARPSRRIVFTLRALF